MSPLEQQMIEFYLQPGKVMLEWGSGFSTLWFSQFVGQYYSIEHDKARPPTLSSIFFKG